MRQTFLYNIVLIYVIVIVYVLYNIVYILITRLFLELVGKTLEP